MIRAACVAAMALFFCCAMRDRASACPVGRGAAIVLVSQELDPDVFLWDSADRLVRYATGDYDVETVLKHTTLIRAFSRAVATGCKNAQVRPSPADRPSSAGPLFLVGVRVLTGRWRGHYGWVLSTDIRGPDGRALSAQRHH